MTYIAGSLPLEFSYLRSFILTHPDFNSGAPGTVTVSDTVSKTFLDAGGAVNTALNTATSGDLAFGVNLDTGRCNFSSAAGKSWEIGNWYARAFFGFGEVIHNYLSAGSAPLGLAKFTGLWVESIEMPISNETREDPGDSYSLIKGKIINLRGYLPATEQIQSNKTKAGLTSDLDWSAYKGQVKIQPGADTAAYGVANLDGTITGRLLGYDIQGKENFLGSDVWEIDLRVVV